MATDEKQGTQKGSRSGSVGSSRSSAATGGSKAPKRTPDDRKRGKDEEASAGGPPVDPADEEFLEENKNKPK